MDEKTYSVCLADGTTFENLKLNGNNFVSTQEIDASVFDGNCSPVKFRVDETEDVHENMKLIHVTKYGNETWFALRDLTEDELAKIQLRSDVDYIAMMAEVEL